MKSRYQRKYSFQWKAVINENIYLNKKVCLFTSRLNHSYLIGHMIISDNKVTLGDIQAFLSNGGCNNQLMFPITEILKGINLLCLGHTWKKIEDIKWV